MNLLEALKTSLPLKRKHWPRYYREMGFHPKAENQLALVDGELGCSLHPTDIVAEDWEVLEPQVSITQTQFWRAYSNALAEEANRPIITPNINVGFVVDHMAKALGLVKS